MTGSRLEHFLKSVGYPDRAPEGSSSFALRVDGMEIVAEDRGGRIVLSYALKSDPSMLPALSGYSAGRILREGAALACDGQAAFLWQGVQAGAGEREMVRLFETFADSCEWWRERVDALRGGGSSGEPDDAMVIRP